MLSGGSDALSDPCLPEFPWSKFPFSGFFAMIAALMTLLADFVGTQYYERKQGLTRVREEHGGSAANSESESGIVAVDMEDNKDRKGKVFGEEEGGGMHIVGMHAHAAHHRHNHPHGQDACDGQAKVHGVGHVHLHGHGHGHDHGFGDRDEDSSIRHVVVSQVICFPFLFSNISFSNFFLFFSDFFFQKDRFYRLCGLTILPFYYIVYEQ